MKTYFALFCLVWSHLPAKAQLSTQQENYTHADSLRGGIYAGRDWWDLLHYDLHVSFNPSDSTISGYNSIRYQVKKNARRMQIDLMEPLQMDSVIQNKSALSFQREGNAFFISLTFTQTEGAINSITIYYHGKPRIASRPPWDGGLIWTKDKNGRLWISVACQGLGASVWYPCKDHQADEPDSASMYVTAPDPLTAVANGHLKSVSAFKSKNGNPYSTYHWVVQNPINNYNLIPYLGHYESFDESYAGEKGPLSTSYWVLDYNVDRAKTFLRKEVQRTLKNLEHWFGPYPFYDDGYKIVDAPHLGMEHQSAIAYGNGYQNGYLGMDLSGTGWGKKWDFIVVHESAHEWFGNSITTGDIADMWVHESFANYAETLFVTSEYGIEAGNDYVIGTRKNIQNDIPIIGKYGVNEEGSGDMYYKGGNMIHMIRQIINNDEKFREILRGLNKDFYHATVTTAVIENYISMKAGIDFSKVFDQYLRTIQIPVLNYASGKEKGKTYLIYFWSNCVPGFNMPVKVSIDPGKSIWLVPGTKVQKLKIRKGALPAKIADRNFYIDEMPMNEPVIKKN